MCICVLAGDVLSAWARQGAATRHDGGGNDGWSVRALSTSVSLKIGPRRGGFASTWRGLAGGPCNETKIGDRIRSDSWSVR